MEDQQWTAKYQQSVGISAGRSDETSHNGICNNLLANADNEEDAGSSKFDENNLNGVCDVKPRVEIVESVISEKSRQVIHSILDQVKSLSKIEKLLLYLKLPTEYSNSIDPLRQPLNPLGSRSEIHRTISWIKTHLEEHPDTSLPKQDVYDQYSNYCNENKIKPLSQADFGKVMKQVYPDVKARRLGTRGNSRYCYSGLTRRRDLEVPILPDLSDKPLSTEPHSTQTDLLAAAWIVIKEWSEKQLGTQFSSLHALARHLVSNLSISSGSPAAEFIASIPESQFSKEEGFFTGCFGLTKHREMQFQLQRKLQQKNEFSREQKRKLQYQSHKPEPKARCKRSKSQPQSLCQSASSSTSPVSVTAELNTGETNTSPTQGPQPVCDKSLDYTNQQALPDFSSFQKAGDKVYDFAASDGETTPEGKVPIPRLSSAQSKPLLSPKRGGKNAKYKAIQPKPEPCDILSYNQQQSLNVQAAENRSQQNPSKCRKQRKRKTLLDVKDGAVLPTLDQQFTRERLESVGNVEKDAMDEYLGTNSSQEQEEELLKYFKNNNIEDSKLSQLRQLLETQITGKIENNPLPLKNIGPTPTKQAIPSNLQTNCTRRRVSFEDPVPPSPNTRRVNFSFTPISPGPISPKSKCSSTNASPFVSPRNTPVPRVRNVVHQTGFNQQPVSANLVNVVNMRRQVKHLAKLKQEPEEQLDTKKYTTMSAPPSPMLPGKQHTNLLQQLLNANNKVAYTPDYMQTQMQSVQLPDASMEISELLSGDVSQNNDLGYRSQSVPLHQMKSEMHINSSYLSQFNFNLDNETVTTNEFTDLEPIAETDTDSVNKIISTLEEQPEEILLQGAATGMEIQPSIFENLNPPLEASSFEFDPLHIPNLENSFVETGIRCNPSRSVPNTPLPVTGGGKIELSKELLVQSSRSYPSTPSLNCEPFNYNSDYLLNGQPVKEKGGIVDDVIPYSDMAYYNIEEGNLDSDVLIDNKGNINFDRQLSEFVVKENVNGMLDGACGIENDQHFETHLNGT